MEKQSSVSVRKSDVYKWDRQIELVYQKIDLELSESNAKLIRKYDIAMVNEGLSKPTRYLHLNTLLSLSRKFKKDFHNKDSGLKDWKDLNREDVEQLIYHLMQTYSDDGKDSEYTYDHKKILEIFFRWQSTRYNNIM